MNLRLFIALFFVCLTCILRAEEISEAPQKATDQYNQTHMKAPEYVDQELAANKLLGRMTTFASDTRSPRSTLESFFYLIDSYYTLINADGVTWQNEDDLDNIALELADLFDMDDIPVNFQGDAAIEASVYMAEYLSRWEMPPLGEVPGEDEMAAAIKAGKLPVYRIPNTPIEISRVNHGELEGHYLFVNTTLTDAIDLYNQAANYPYLSNQFKGFYELYFLTSGPMIPTKLIRSLPAWMSTDIYEQTIWQWILTFLGFMAMFGIIYLLHFIIKKISRKLGPLFNNILSLVLPLATISLTKSLIYFLDEQVFLTGKAWKFIIMISDVIVLAANITIIIVIGSIVAEAILKSENLHMSNRRIDQYLIRLGIRIVSIVIAIGVLIQGLQALGFSGSTLLAGASVSGLAVALAAQSTLKNVFGSIMLVLDKPFIIGERIVTKDFDGIVEEIGLRSTRIRTLSGHLVSIPNEELSASNIENVGRRPHIKRSFNITITYDTTPDDICTAIRIVEDILALKKETKTEAHSDQATDEESKAKKLPPSNAPINTKDFPPRVYFNELNSDSLNLMVAYWYHPPEYWDYLQHATWVNTEIIRQFNEAGIKFAFPTQTVYLEKSDSMTPEASIVEAAN